MSYTLADAGRAYVGDAVASDPVLTVIISRLHECIDRVHKCAENTTRNADRVFGAIPPMAEGVGRDGPKSDGTINAVQTLIDNLHATISRMDEAAIRFNAL